MILEAGGVRRSRRSEPSGQRVSEPQLSQVVRSPTHAKYPQHGGRSSDRPEYRKLSRTNVLGVDSLNPICPRCDVETAGFIKVEQHRPGIVQQGEDPQRAGGGVVTRSTSGMRRPSSGCPSPRS